MMINTKVWDTSATASASNVGVFGSIESSYFTEYCNESSYFTEYCNESSYFTEYCNERTAKDVAMKKVKELEERCKGLEAKLKAQKPIPKVKRILKNGDYMTVLWEDGDKTIVKRAEDEAESDYAAFTAALGIKVYGSNSALKRLVASAEVQGKKKKKQKEEK